MKALASFILRGLSQAMLVAVGTAVLALILPPLSLMSGAAVALVTLRKGAQPGAIVMAGGTVLVAALAYLSLGNPLPGLVFLGVLWLPVWVLAWVLREFRSLSLATIASGGFGLAGVVLVYLLAGDITAWWQQELLLVFQPVIEAGGTLADPEEVKTILAGLAKIMTGLAAAGMVLNALMCLFLARGWQAQLFNPGGFRSEFHELRLGKAMAIATAIVIVVSMLPVDTLAQFATEIMIVVLGLYIMQGLALVHAIVARRNMHVAWLVGLYLVVMFVLPQLLALVAVVGLIDTWVDFRRRLV